MTTPTLSIIMPVFNAEACLREAVESILAQIYTDFELIIVEDGSTDNSREVLNNFIDRKIRVHTGSSISNLQQAHIAQTFLFRDQIFGTSTSRIKIWTYFQHIRHYRRSQLASNPIIKYAHLLLSVLCYPQKLISRLF